jgi:hypothetical protein
MSRLTNEQFWVPGYGPKDALSIRQIIFVDMDAVMTDFYQEHIWSLFPAVEPVYIHGLRLAIAKNTNRHPKEFSDVSLLMLTASQIVFTCWSYDRLSKSLEEYIDWRVTLLQWEPTQVRVYSLGKRLF